MKFYGRSQTATPIQVAERVIEIIKDTEKQTPKLRIIVQHNKEEILKVGSVHYFLPGHCFMFYKQCLSHSLAFSMFKAICLPFIDAYKTVISSQQ